MPSFTINTYGEIIRDVKVTKIISEEPTVANITKEVKPFEKYASKKVLKNQCKEDMGVER
ncbi:MAG: hypothetical protein E7378_02840 [Clostridiales bacterium]|nr:hypothetical protein [Clostridiales bacterium]